MGSIVEIVYSDSEAYSDYIGEEMARDLDRDGFRALAFLEEEGTVNGALVWRSLSNEEYMNSEAEVAFFKAGKYETGTGLLKSFIDEGECDGIKKAHYELSGLSEEEKKSLTDSGFSLEERESRDLYKKLGSIAENRSLRARKIPSYVKPLSELEPAKITRGIARSLFARNRGSEDDISTIPVEWFDEEVSCCICTDSRVTGMVLVHMRADGVLMPVLFYSSGVEAPKELLIMLCYSLYAAINKFGRDTVVRLRRHDKKTYKLASYLFPKDKGATVMAGERSVDI